jgi:hypothetical protein
MADKKSSLTKSKYDPSMCKTIVDLGLQGASQKMIWSQLGISKTTADNYKKKYPEFAEALDLALVHSQSYWESMLLANLDNKSFNSRLCEIALRGQFGSDYRERMDIKQDVKVEANIDFQGAVNDLINKLKESAQD